MGHPFSSARAAHGKQTWNENRIHWPIKTYLTYINLGLLRCRRVIIFKVRFEVAGLLPLHEFGGEEGACAFLAHVS